MLNKETFKNYITATEYARRIGRSPVVVTRKIRNGLVPEAVRVGTQWLVPANLEWVNRHEQKIPKTGRTIYKNAYEETNINLNDYISLADFARKHNIQREKIYREFILKSSPHFIKHKRSWYIKKDNNINIENLK